MDVPDLNVRKRLFCGAGNPEILGRGSAEVRGSAYLEGPEIVGNPNQFVNPSPFELGGTMAGQRTNTEMKPIPFYAFISKFYARVVGFLKTDVLFISETIRCKVIFAEVVLAKTKNFCIPHPQKKGYDLVYSCLEGAENGVYHRGRLRGDDVITLPEVWKDLVDESSITVSLTPVGMDQGLYVKGMQQFQILVAGKPGLPIDCYYHVYAERIDVPKLKTERPH